MDGGIAESWAFEKNNATLVLKIRKGVKFPSGKPVNGVVVAARPPKPRHPDRRQVLLLHLERILFDHGKGLPLPGNDGVESRGDPSQARLPLPDSRALPFEEGDQVMLLRRTNPRQSLQRPTPVRDYLAWRFEQEPALSKLRSVA